MGFRALGRSPADPGRCASTAVRQAFPLAEFRAIDSAGHIPQYERPEVVNPLLLRFLGAD